MALKSVKGFKHVLQTSIEVEDREWCYYVSQLPHATISNSGGMVKFISVVSNNKKQNINLSFEHASPNRAIASDSLNRFILISFTDFRLQISVPTPDGSGTISKPATARESADYIARFLRAGLIINGVHYHFYGHSNSQLKSRSCVLFAGSKEEITTKVNGLGDFSKMKTVAKKSKRIGLLFSTAHMALKVASNRCQDVPDVLTKDYNFTDGCGLISKSLANILVQKRRIAFRNVRYVPSVFQIRYRGYKGVVTIDPALKGEIWLKLRTSMKKFSGGDDLSFSVVEYSKPYCFGYLNDEIVLLLHALGVQEAVLMQKQLEHFRFLAEATVDPRNAFRLLTCMDRTDVAETLLLEGLQSVKPKIASIVNSEHNRTLNKREEQRCRIMIPKSRLLFGVCDAWNVLKDGECAVRITTEDDGQPKALKGMEVLVTRNPCLHPGDLQKFKAVQRDELGHLVDCIVFPTRGRRPSTDLMSGGDLDGDKFFVCWDPDLIPSVLSEPAEYPGAREPVKFAEITDDDRLEYFAKYTNASLGRAKNLFLGWARLHGPMSKQCQELNRLFSTCVDGNRIKIPTVLEDPPRVPSDGPPFILDTLHEAATEAIKEYKRNPEDYDDLSFDAMELLLCRDNIAMTEFELLKLTQRWCLETKNNLISFIPYFDFNQLDVSEKNWLLSELPPSTEVPSLVLNNLLQSNLLGRNELRPFKLDHPGLRWKCIFDSTRDRLGTFLDVVSRTLEMFHRKFLVIHVNDRFTVGIYIPRVIGKSEECSVDDKCLLFAFPHSQGAERAQHRVVPTKVNYRLYCDGNVFQLYESKRANTWVYVRRSLGDDSSYRNINNKGDKRRARQRTLDEGVNDDCKISIALDKFSRPLQKHLGTVNRNGILAAEIYVISNRDTQAMQNLDLWVHQVDTEERLPLFERNAREYTVPKLTDVDWSTEPDRLVRLAKHRDLFVLKEFQSKAEVASSFYWLLDHGEFELLHQIYDYLARTIDEDFPCIPKPAIVHEMVDFLSLAPQLANVFSRTGDWGNFTPEICNVLRDSALAIIRAIILSANEMQRFVIKPLKTILAQVAHIQIPSLIELVEAIALSVRSPELALDLFLDCLEPETSRLLTERPSLVRHAVRSAIGVALDHIDEAASSQRHRNEILDLKFANGNPKSSVLETRLRIDARATGALIQGDHVVITAASPPINSLTTRTYTMDAVVLSSDPGFVKLHCLHPPPRFVEDCSWRLSNCGSFVTSKTMLDAIAEFATKLGTCCGVYRQILGLEEPPVDSVSAGYKSIPNLNASQERALNSSLTYPLTCLWGPPGTGKTYTVVAILVELLAMTPEQRILVTAPTHNAVDNVMRKFVEESRGIAEHTRPLRVSTDVRKVSDDLKKYTCDAMVGKELSTNYSGRRQAQKRIEECRLIFTTCIGAGLGLLREQQFSIVIIDEASQQSEPASLVPLVKGCHKAILVGDHVQLRATAQQHAVLQEYDVSLFERLYTRESEIDHLRAGLSKVMLDTQYRMHEEVCRFSSANFYEGKLLTGVSPNQRSLSPSNFPWPKASSGRSNGAKARMVFVQCSTAEDLGQKSKGNQGQAQLCREVCEMLCTEPSPPTPSPKSPPTTPVPQVAVAQQSIAVLTPYSRQSELLKAMLSGFRGVEVSSIDGFQGREADIVVFCTVRCNVHHEIGFLKDMRRMNVALTRARAAVIVIGDRDTLTKGTTDPESTKVWKKLMEALVSITLGMEGVD